MGCSRAKAPVARILEDRRKRKVPKQMCLYQHGELRCGRNCRRQRMPWTRALRSPEETGKAENQLTELSQVDPEKTRGLRRVP